MELVDTHCHVQSAGLLKGERTTRELWAKAPELTPDTIIQHAKKAGVTKLVCVGCDLDDSRIAVDFVKDRLNCWASIGIHPHESQHFANNQAKLDEFANLAIENKVVAIGECGLDYYYEHSPKSDQLKVLEFQLNLAEKHNLPLIFHVREAFEDFWPIFDKFENVQGVLHSFTDNSANLQEAHKRGLYIGVNGIATFTRDDNQLDTYKAVPLESLVLETDAPFLTPVPFRGSINEPKRVREVAEFMAKLRGEDLAVLATATSANSSKLFGI